MLYPSAHLKNGLFPKVGGVVGFTYIVLSDVQFEYLQPVITQYFASNKSEIWS